MVNEELQCYRKRHLTSVNNFYVLFSSPAVLFIFVFMTLYFTFYNFFVVILSLLSHNEFLFLTLGILRWLFLFTLFSFSSYNNFFPDRYWRFYFITVLSHRTLFNKTFSKRFAMWQMFSRKRFCGWRMFHSLIID